MRVPLRAAILAATVVAAVPLTAQSPAEADLEQLLAKATWYAIDFVNKLSNVVAEERYIQDSNVALATVAIPGLNGRGAAGMNVPRGSSRHRELRSDFLIVKSAADLWTPFRDVFEVDHIPIRDRDQRLAKLFLSAKPDADAEAQAKAIADESGRYNLGAVQRTINNPVFALAFLQPDVRAHFKFTEGKPDRKAGPDIRVIDYVEEWRPTVITGLPGQEMPAFGRFWIENATGRVVKAEIRVEVREIKANLTTTFRADERLGIDVPSEFREDYDLRDSRVSGVASYARFRKFEVKSSEELATPEQATPDGPPNTMLTYPKARKDGTVTTYGGMKVADPYRWMESLDSKEVAGWVAASNSVTEPYLNSLPLREHFRKRLTELWNYPRVGVPSVEGGHLFYARNTGLQKQAPVFMRAGATAPPTLVIDPNVVSADGSVSLSEWAPSPDAKLFAYGLSEGGADWSTVHVRDIASGKDLPDEVRWMRFSGISWTNDSRGFFYSRYPEPPKNKVLEAALSGHAVYYHRIGTPQSQDTLIYQRKDLPRWVIYAIVTEDGRYLLITMAEGADNKNRLYVADLGDPKAPKINAAIRAIAESDDAEYAPIGNSGSTLYVRSDKGTPNRIVAAIDLAQSGPAVWKTIVAEQKEAIETVALVGGRLVVQYLVDVQSRLRLFDLNGAPSGEIALPGTGTVGALSGRQDSPDVWYSFTSPLTPSTVYSFNPSTTSITGSTPFEAATPPVNTSGFETKAMFATSKDGTRVPFFLTAKKNLPLDGSNPTMLYGYGGFSIAVLPSYRQDVPAWLERGGVWVTVNMRGGSEYGEAWHKAGMLEKKQNVFDDFIAVAEYLIREKYTSPANLGIMGGSNGGTLVGAVMEQRPELFAVALPAVGVMDMLRYDQFTGGKLWTTEYGSASNPAQFPFLIKYSPLHNVKAGVCYPATLVTTADHDDRVVPSHSFKFAATLQAAQGCAKPVLIRVEVQGSHGYRPTDKLIAERADEWAFAAANMGLK